MLNSTLIHANMAPLLVLNILSLSDYVPDQTIQKNFAGF